MTICQATAEDVRINGGLRRQTLEATPTDFAPELARR